MELITVIVIDDDDDLRDALAGMLDATDDIEVAGTAADAIAGIRLGGEVRPDVAVVDVHMPRGGGPAAAAGIRERSPATRLVAMSSADQPGSRQRMADAGVDDFVVKADLGRRLLPVVRAVARGDRPSGD